MNIHSTSKPYAAWGSVCLGGTWLLLLLYLLTGCGPTATTVAATEQPEPMATAAIPYLLTQVEANAWMRDAILLPDHRVYFLGDNRISVIDGVAPAEQITFPGLTSRKRWYLSDLAQDPVTGLIYVGDQYEDAVYVIRDTAVITSLTGIFEQPRWLVADEDTGELYVFYTSQRSGTPRSYASVIAGTEVVADIVFPHLTQAVRYNPVDGYMYIVGETQAPLDSRENVLMILDNHHVITTHHSLVEKYAGGMNLAVNPQTGDIHMLIGTTVLTWDRGQDWRSINLFDAGHRSVNCLAVDPRRGWTYACTWKDGPYIVVVDQEELLAEIPVQQWPYVAAVDATHDYVYIGHYDPTNLSVIRGTELITTLNITGYGTTNVIVDEERGYIYTANSDDATVSVFGFADPVVEPKRWFEYLPFVHR